MRRLSIARSVQLALLGLTLVLTTVAAVGVASLYSTRQTYEDRLAEALELQAGAARLLAAGVVEEATLRARGEGAARTRRRARQAFEAAVAGARAAAANDARSLAFVEQVARTQAQLRSARGGPAPLDPRRPLAQLSRRQQDRIGDAREEARRDSRRALIAIVAGGGLALLGALALVAALLAAMRRPLDQLVSASGRLAGGELEARVDEEGPDELRELSRSFNAMAEDLERARERIDAERRRLDITVRSLGDGLIIVDREGVVTAINPRAVQLVPGLAVGLRPRDAGLELPRLDDALAREVPLERDGTVLAVTAARLEEASAEGGVVWTLRDVSERARLERLKTEFVATASHELRSPLTSIKGFIELLAASEGLDPRQREFVEIVHVSTNRLVELVNDLLDVARIEAGRVDVQRRPTDVRDCVREVARLLWPRIEAKRQTLSLELDPDVPRAMADPVRVRQIVTNLLTNAHLYTGEGGRLTLSVDEATDGVRIAVADTGRGMTQEDLEHIFDRFYRGGDGTVASGTGLGLSIVRSLVDLHHGNLEVESEVDQGTTFTVVLPPVPDAHALPAARHALYGKRVLVIDDEPEVTRLIAETLTEFGVDAVECHDGAQALQRLREEHFDAVTVDILMRGVSGFDVLRAMRDDDRLRRMPAVVVSVFSGREALSGEWVVSKPIDAEELADALGAAVLAGRVRVIVVGRELVREQLRATLDELAIEHEWAATADHAARLCADRYFEVALVDAEMPDLADAISALDLRGRRLRRSVVVVSTGDATSGFVRLDADPVPLADAGATVLGLLEAEPAAPLVQGDESSR